MKLTGAQQRAYNALRAAPEGRLASGSGGNFKRTTMEALARKGLVDLTRKMDEREVRHRNGTTSRMTVVVWTAHLKPVLPDAQELAELDLILELNEKTLRPTQREHAAAYVAVMAPSVALEGAPVKEADYSPAAAYVAHLALETPQLLTAFMVVRSLSGEVKLPPDTTEAIGELTDFWVATEEGGTPAQPGKELGRVRGDSQNAAAICANSLLNRRAGYALRRLGAKELGTWVKDFRADGRVLRLSGDEESGTFRVVDVASGVLVVTAPTVAEAERAALAEVSSLTAAMHT